MFEYQKSQEAAQQSSRLGRGSRSEPPEADASAGRPCKSSKPQLEQQLAKFTADEKGAEADAADEAIRRRQIRSPLDGVVSQVTPHLGEWVKPGDSVLHILRMDRLQVEGFFKARQYPQAEIRDRPVTVTLEWANHAEPVQFSGRIVFVSPQEEAGNEYRIKAEVENRLVPGSNDEWLLHPGTNVTDADRCELIRTCSF